MHSQSTGSAEIHVVLYPAMFGCPADVIASTGEEITYHETFNVGHVFTDNYNARTFGLVLAAKMGVTLEVVR
jgi:hypothetical protein